jgi:deoxycytidine triphosphate deaminase
MFLSYRDIQNRLSLARSDLLISPFNQAALSAVGYSIAVGPKAYTALPLEGSLVVGTDIFPALTTWSEISLLDAPLDLAPGSSAYVISQESLKLPLDLISFVMPLSSVSRTGLDVGSFLIHPGWSGHVTMLVRNTGQLTLRLAAGVRIAAILFAQLTSPVELKAFGAEDKAGDLLGVGVSVDRRPLERAREPLRNRHTIRRTRGQIEKRSEGVAVTEAIAVRVVLMTDQVDSTPAMEKSIIDGVSRTKRQRKMVLDAVRKHGGRGEPAAGDATLSFFDTVDAALSAAIAARTSFEQYNAKLPPSDHLAVHCAIHKGYLNEGEKLGPAINTTARILHLGAPNEILISEEARVEARTPPYRFRFRTVADLKGIGPVPVYNVAPLGESVGTK